MTPREQINAAIETLRDLWPNHDGPAHIVLADFNVRDSDMEWCIGEIDSGKTYTNDETLPVGHPIYAATRAVLKYMLYIPWPEREAWAEDPYAALYGS